MLNQADSDAIAAAVTQAEATTSAEIVCVLARRVSDYGETPLIWGAAAALLLPPLALAVGLDLPRVNGDWIAAHSSALESSRTTALAAYAFGQAVLFAVVAALVALPPLRTRLTPAWVKTRRVRQAAMAQLSAAVLAAGEKRAAVVIFAADDEHRVEVLASAAAHEAVGQTVWDAAMAELLSGLRRNDPTGGLTRAVQICGEALSRHFPQERPDANVLPDRPIEL